MSHESLTERVGERTLMSILLALAVMVLVGGVLALAADDDALPAEGARVRLDGVGSFSRPDGSGGALRDGTILHRGDQVEMEEGTAVLELAAGGTVEVRGGHGDVDDSRVEVGSPVRLLAGDALAQGPAGMAVEAAGTLVTLRGASSTAARVRRELAVTTAAYRGAVDVDSAGQARTVPALRQLAVASVGRSPEQPDPLEVDVADPWDQRFLGGAIALTSSLNSLSAVFTAQSAVRDSADDFAAVLPILDEEDGFDSAMLDPDRPDGETLVGGAIAALAEDGSFDRRWEAVFAFRDAGADWGLVALDQEVEGTPVLREVEAALSRSVTTPTGEVAAPVTVPPATPTPGAPPTSATPTTSAPTPTTEPPTTPTTPTTPPPIVPPGATIPPIGPSEPVPETGSELLDGLLEPVGELLGGLLGG